MAEKGRLATRSLGARTLVELVFPRSLQRGLENELLERFIIAEARSAQRRKRVQVINKREFISQFPLRKVE